MLKFGTNRIAFCASTTVEDRPRTSAKKTKLKQREVSRRDADVEYSRRHGRGREGGKNKKKGEKKADRNFNLPYGPTWKPKCLFV